MESIVTLLYCFFDFFYLISTISIKCCLLIMRFILSFFEFLIK